MMMRGCRQGVLPPMAARPKFVRTIMLPVWLYLLLFASACCSFNVAPYSENIEEKEPRYFV